MKRGQKGMKAISKERLLPFLKNVIDTVLNGAILETSFKKGRIIPSDPEGTIKKDA